MKKTFLPAFILITLLAGGMVMSVLLYMANQGRQSKVDGWVKGNAESLTNLHALASSLKDLDNAELGYVLTGRDAYWQSFLKDLTVVPPLLGRLNLDGSSNKLPADQVHLLVEFAQAKLLETRSVMTLRKNTTFDTALAAVQQDTGRRLMEGIRAEIDSMADSQDHRMGALYELKEKARTQRAHILQALILQAIIAVGFTIYLLLREIRRRRSLVQALRGTNLLTKALASVGDGVLLTDPQGKIVFANEAAIALTGWTAEEMIKAPCAGVVRCLNASSRKPESCAANQCLDSRRLVRTDLDTLLIRKDGTEVPIDLCATPIQEPGGSLYGAALILRDEASREEAKEVLRRSKEDLENANRAKDLFFATLSHELRTPLAPVLATLSSWEERDDLPRAASLELPMLRRNIEVEARIIDDLLDLTRVIHGTLSLRKSRIDFYEVLRITVQSFARDVRSREIRFLLQLDGQDAWVMGDATRLQQVLGNVIGNAVKFTPAGGEVRVTGCQAADGRIEVEVQDNGIGMSASILQRLFKPFQQGDRAKRYGGLGLGMAISKALMDGHGGSLSASSDGPGMGSTFRLMLPAMEVAGEERPSAPPVETDVEEGIPPHLKLLLVEDHEDTAAVLVKLLKGAGYDVQVQSRVGDALCAVKAAQFDLIISDLGLPDGSGIDFVRKLRGFSQTPAIALTGYGTEHDIAECRKAGFDSHLVKPLSFDVLRKEIRRVFQSRS